MNAVFLMLLGLVFVAAAVGVTWLLSHPIEPAAVEITDCPYCNPREGAHAPGCPRGRSLRESCACGGAGGCRGCWS